LYLPLGTSDKLAADVATVRKKLVITAKDVIVLRNIMSFLLV